MLGLEAAASTAANAGGRLGDETLLNSLKLAPLPPVAALSALPGASFTPDPALLVTGGEGVPAATLAAVGRGEAAETADDTVLATAIVMAALAGAVAEGRWCWCWCW